MKTPRIAYDPDPICGACGEELNACDFGVKYGEGVYCALCNYWWPGASYYPTPEEIETRDGERGKRIPWEVLIDMYKDYGSTRYAEGYAEGYADAKAGRPNENEVIRMSKLEEAKSE